MLQPARDCARFADPGRGSTSPIQARTDSTAEQLRSVLQRMIDMFRQSGFGSNAVITSNDVVFGMARMPRILSELEGGPEVKVFRTRNEGIGLADEEEEA